jgi:hypothetical protein|tara:strand:- start:25 stop:477 length:453 start_codon:yes stop_codon:yes gene_type:complete
MTIYIASVNAEGNPESIWTTGVTPDIEEGPDLGNIGNTIVHVEGLLQDTRAFINTHYYKAGEWVARDESPGAYYNWKNEEWVLDSPALFTLIRQERDLRLYQCDWTQAADSPLTDAKKAEWATYRQYLRTIPIDNSDVIDIDGVAWPTAP